MLDMMTGPFWGIVAVALIAALVTLGCFVAMFWFIARPGETNPRHVKFDILRPDR
ncbi:MAG: hypothetical protein JSR27_04920 [Proteobacteria bacterium]|nr:hypothetical protein [Pseudomonadota bacterium]